VADARDRGRTQAGMASRSCSRSTPPASTATPPPPTSASPRPSAARTTGKIPVTRATTTWSRHSEMAGQSGNPDESGLHNRPHRSRPWAGLCPSVDRTDPENRHPPTHSGRRWARKRTSNGVCAGHRGAARAERAGCNTVGSALRVRRSNSVAAGPLQRPLGCHANPRAETT
jgi:hypothetical protein